MESESGAEQAFSEDDFRELAESSVLNLLTYIGEDETRPGLADTPARVARALREMTRGYDFDPREILSRSFAEDGYDQMIVVPGIRFASLCEHHLLPFTGTATVAYLPTGKRVVGLSKIPRLVECFAQRLQMQERMTHEIAQALMDEPLEAAAAGVIVRARHSCMAIRGVRKPDAEMVTSCLLGSFQKDDAARAELFALVRSNGG